MGMDRVAATARAVPAGAPGGEAGLTLAALIDVLDRADEVLVRTRPRPRRAALHRPSAARTVADRWDPLRDQDLRPGASARRPGRTSRALVGPAGTNRPVPRVVPARAVPLRSVPSAPPARLPAVHASAGAPVRDAVRPPAATRVTPPLATRLRAALASVARRAASWGAGPGGAHLAWNAPAPVRVYRAGPPPVPAPRRGDPPVELRELPSTPTASAPPRPARTAPPQSTPVRPRPSGRTTPVRPLRSPALSTVRRIPPLPPVHGSVPNRARSPGGVRGSPGTGPARGSPPWWPEPGRAPSARTAPVFLRGS